MHKLESVLEAELQDDALRGVRVRRAVPGDLVEATESGELDAATTNGNLLGDDSRLALIVGAEVVNEGCVQVESRAEVLAVVAQGMPSKRAHVSDHLRGREVVHCDLALGSAELEGGSGSRRGGVDNLDEVMLQYESQLLRFAQPC